MAALTAIRVNPRLGDYYQRAIAAGKSPRFSPAVCVDKLLVPCNALCHKQTT